MSKLVTTLKKTKIYAIAFLCLTTLLLGPIGASAESNIDTGLKNAGISDNTGGKLEGADFNGAVIFIIMIAGIWTLACIIFAAMKISGAQGNAQKRVEGIIGLAFAGGGAWVIYNAYNIFGWFSSIGGKAGLILLGF